MMPTHTPHHALPTGRDDFRPTQPDHDELDQQALNLVQSAFEAARSGQAIVLAELLERGVPANVRNQKGDSLLMLAAYHGHADAVSVLTQHGAELEAINDRGQTPLQGAAFKGDVEVVRRLLEAGASVDDRGAIGRTPLMFAAMFDRVDVVTILLRNGANPALCDDAGNSAYSLALAMGATRALALLAPSEVASVSNGQLT